MSSFTFAAGSVGCAINSDQLRDRQEVLERIVTGIGLHVRQHRDHAVIGDHDGVAVRMRAGSRAHPEEARGARLILHIEALAEAVAHLLAHEPRDDIDGAGRRQRDQEPDRPVGIGRRLGEGCRGRCQAARQNKPGQPEPCQQRPERACRHDADYFDAFSR